MLNVIVLNVTVTIVGSCVKLATMFQVAAATENDPFSGNDDGEEDEMLARALEASMAQFNQEKLRKPNETYRFVGMRLLHPLNSLVVTRNMWLILLSKTW
jgi:hypothetical protein